MDIYRSGEEKIPYVIKPKNTKKDTSIVAPLKRWVLISQERYTTNIIQYLSNYIQTPEILSFFGEDLIFKTGLGEDIVIKSDGKVIFPSSVSGKNAVEDEDFITKRQVPRLVEGEKNTIIQTTYTIKDNLYSYLIDFDEEYKDKILCVWLDNVLDKSLISKIESVNDTTLKIYTENQYDKVKVVYFKNLVELIEEYYLSAWGNFDIGDGNPIGDTELIFTQAPQQIIDEREIIDISTGSYFTIIIKQDNTLWISGKGVYDTSLGLGDEIWSVDEFTQIGTDEDWVKVESNSYHTYLLKSDGSLWGWGSNWFGELGLEDEEPRYIPTQIGTDTDWKEISAAEYTSFCIKENGTLWSSGANWYGNLGVGDWDDRNILTQVGTDTDWVKVSTDWYNVMGIKTDGSLWGWGYNWSRGLGVDETHIYSPIQIGSDTDWKEICVPGWSSFVIKENGTLWSCGRNIEGQLGLGHNTNITRHTQVGTDTDWKKVYSRYFSTFVIKEDKSLWSCGMNNNGQLGLGMAENQNTLQQVGNQNIWEKVSYLKQYAVGMTTGLVIL